MKGCSMISALVLATVLSSGWAYAQTDDDYEDESSESNRFALGLGVGLVEPANEVETYLMAAFRIRVAGREGSSDPRGHDPRGDGMTGYLEPEIGYWEASGDRVEGSDLLAGVNLIGVVPLGSVDSFFGVGAGVHFIDASLLEGDPRATDSETKFGANAQFGIDLYITRNLSAFGAGRFDLVQGSDDSIQSKVYLGLRGRF